MVEHSLARCLIVAGMLLAGGPRRVAAESPFQRLKLESWKLTLPRDEDGNGSADEILPKDLADFSSPEFFFARDQDPIGVVFRAPCGGSTTRGSKYPRCELREMHNGREADWSTGDANLHVLKIRLQVSATPAVKKHVVCAQIHDAKDDVLMVRLEGEKLLIERNAEGDVVLDRKYRLGAPFDLRIAAGRGRIQVAKDGVEHLNWETRRSGCYFKAGCYTQSNLKSGDAADSFGEVVLHSLSLSKE